MTVYVVFVGAHRLAKADTLARAQAVARDANDMYAGLVRIHQYNSRWSRAMEPFGERVDDVLGSRVNQAFFAGGFLGFLIGWVIPGSKMLWAMGFHGWLMYCYPP